MEKFTHLHVHTEYSVQDGASKIKDMIKKAKNNGMEAVAITDHGNMFGTTHFYKACKDENIKPIIGCEVYTEDINGKREAHHLVLLAKNKIGYSNLSKLVSWAYDNFYNKPQVSWENLKEYSEGIICLSACLGGEIAQSLIANDYENAKKVAMEFKGIFKEDFYLEMQRHNLQEESYVNPMILKLGKELDIKVVASGDTHFTNEEDKETQDILLCLQTGKTINDPTRWSFSGDGHHFQTQEEMNDRFKDLPDLLKNTQEIVDKVNLELELNKVSMPKFEVPTEFKDEASYFEHLTWEGFDRRFKDKEAYTNPVYKERLEYELRIIEQMGFEGYFLIVQDFIMYAKNKGIMVGPGRGSCVGSLVSYCLQITDLDPIPLNLLFERFLNPERVSNPDMDIDFEYERREEVVEYVIKKYGTESVCGIITFGTFGAKGVVRDVARVLEFPYSVGDKIAKAIPLEVKMTLTKALDMSPELNAMYKNEPDVKRIIDASLHLEGLVRHTSTHACGKVIAPKAVVDFLPEAQILDKKTKTRVRVSQMTDVEEMGLLKFDFLGLRTMGVIGNALKFANIKNKGKKKIEYLDIPLTDWEVYKYISTGDTFGVFQLEGGGMQQLMKDMFADVEDEANKIIKLKLDKKEEAKKLDEFGFELFERLVSAVSLYRPGPLDYIPQYLEGMRNPESIHYDCPELEEILKPTYGTIVYQEQVQMIVRKLAGYSLGRGDLIRRAMGKKKSDVMEQEKEYFINGKLDEEGNIEVMGCRRNGISEEVAIIIWDKMADFAKYAFNKSHAAAYAMIAYITAWIKHYYPIEFMTAMLNSFITTSKKLKLYIRVCLNMGIQLLPPDVNNSQQYFSIEGENSIRFGLMGLKNMGKTSMQILEEREDRGIFNNYQDLAERMAKHQKIGRKELQAIIYSSAGDCFEGTRNAKLSILEKILKSASVEKNNFQSGQLDIFGLKPEFAVFKAIQTPEMEEFDKKFKLEKEKEYAGFYVTEHPLDDYEKYFIEEKVTEIGIFDQEEVDEDEDMDDEEIASFINYEFDGQRVKVAGIVKDLKIYYTKKDQKPLYVFKIEDRTGELDAVIFSDRIELNHDKLIEDKIVIVEGTMKHDDRGLQLIVKNMFDIEAIAKSETPKCIWVKAIEKTQFSKLNEIVSNNKGQTPVYLRYQNQSYKASDEIALNFSTFSKIQEIFGDGVKIMYS